jgi:hypothetical protein
MIETPRIQFLDLNALDQCLSQSTLSPTDRKRLQTIRDRAVYGWPSDIEEVRWAARLTYRDDSYLMVETRPNVKVGPAKLPTAAEFTLHLMSRQRRNDVLNDMLDWYPHWVQEKGRFSANVLCWWRTSVAVLGGLLDVAGRIAEIVGKFRGAK